MTRASDISSVSDFEVEHLREEIRDRRSSRYRRNLQAIVVAVTQVAGALASTAVLIQLLGLL
jgi:hypothetical protein